MLGFTYLAYIFFSLGITIWVGRTLNRNGRIFLLENYADNCLLYTSPSPRDRTRSRMPSSA